MKTDEEINAPTAEKLLEEYDEAKMAYEEMLFLDKQYGRVYPPFSIFDAGERYRKAREAVLAALLKAKGVEV